MRTQRAGLSRHASVAKAIGYMFKCLHGFARFPEDDANQAPPHVEAVDVGSGTGDRAEAEQVAAVDVGSGTGDRAEAEQVAAVDVGAGTGDRVEVEPGEAGASTPPAAVDPAALDVSIDSLLRRRALFEVETAPNMPYLIETRPDFVDSSKFLGSDYFLSRAGLEAPDRTMKRLGDAYVEHRLVRDQIFEATGSRYLAGFIDMRAQMQALYDNALGQQQRLDLAVGVALTREQVSGLTADILWLERITVRGQQVLVPRLYLSSATRDDIDFESARLHGARTVVRAGTLVNSGRVAGIDGLDIRTTHALLNTGGALASESDIHIDAGALFGNISGTVSGNNVWIAAGVIQHDTAKTLDRYDNGFAERVQQIARIEARGDLRLDAGHSILSTGGVLRSEGSTTLTSGGDIALTALSLERFREDEIRGGYSRSASLVHRLGSVRAGGALAVEAGNRLTLRGVKADAGGDARLAAGGDVEIASVQDRRSDDLKIEIEGGGLFGVDTDIRRQDAAIETKRTAIAAGGDLSIRSDKGDIALVAPRLKSKGETVLEAPEGKLALLTSKDASFAQDRERSEDLLWWKERDKGHSREIVRHVEIEAGGGLVIRAGEGVLAEYRKTGSLEASLDQLEQSPGLAWVGQLRDDPKADWRGVEAAFKEWDYEAQGLTEAGAALVSLIAVAATAGTLSTLSAAIAKGLGIAGQGAMHVAMQGAIKAGLTSLVSQASVALVNNRGDLGATLKQLGSSATLTSLATAMITAGLTSGIESAVGIGADLPASAPLADRVVHDLQRGLVRASVRAGVTTAIQDGEIGEAFISAVRLEAAYALGQNAAREIGIAAAHGDLDTAGQLIAHAALGCAIGAAASGDCGSGALGGFVGETVGLLRGQAIEEWAAQRLADVRDGTLKEGGFLAELNELKAAGVDMARLAGGFAAALAGGDADLGAGTAGNAAENNAVFTTTALIVIALGALYATVLGEGDPGKGLARIGEGEDPLSKAIAAGAAEAVKLSYEAFPEATEDVLWALEQSGNAMDATISWIDAATGETVSKAWSALDEETRNQIKGGTIIVTVGLSAGTVKYLTRLRNLRPKAPNAGTPEGGKVIEKVASRKLPFDDPERVTEVNKTLDRIENGGPFPHIEDDKVFENRDGLLPKRGEYREYTVDTPGMSHRAKRRIVIDIKSGRTYYTDDHYDSFVEINPRRD